MKTRKSIWDPDQPDSGEKPSGPGWNSPPEEGPVQPPAALSILEQLRPAGRRRDRSWEKQPGRRTTSYRGVPPPLRAALLEIATDIQVKVDEVARAFLEYGLQCYRRGEITIQPVLSRQRLTLFPEPDSWGAAARPGWYEQVWPADQTKHLKHGRPGNGKPDLPWRRSMVSYRGLPDELVVAIRELSQNHHLPAGEVVTLFLGHALTVYRSGRLILEPKPRQGD